MKKKPDDNKIKEFIEKVLEEENKPCLGIYVEDDTRMKSNKSLWTRRRIRSCIRRDTGVPKINSTDHQRSLRGYR